MLNKKFAGLFLIPAILGTINVSHAALSNSATQTLQATLAAYLDIQALTSGSVTTTSIDPETGALATGLISKFQVRANSNAPTLYLKATTESSTNPSEVAFFNKADQIM